MSNDPVLPDPREVASSLLNQHKNAGRTDADKRRLAINSTLITFLSHTFEPHDLQHQEGLRGLVEDTATLLSEMVSAKNGGEFDRAYVRGLSHGLKVVSEHFAALIRNRD